MTKCCFEDFEIITDGRIYGSPFLPQEKKKKTTLGNHSCDKVCYDNFS